MARWADSTGIMSCTKVILSERIRSIGGKLSMNSSIFQATKQEQRKRNSQFAFGSIQKFIRSETLRASGESVRCVIWQLWVSVSLLLMLFFGSCIVKERLLLLNTLYIICKKKALVILALNFKIQLRSAIKLQQILIILDDFVQKPSIFIASMTTTKWELYVAYLN